MSDPIEISPTALAALLASGVPVTVVDVREAWEWEYNRISGAVHLPLSQMESRHAEVLTPVNRIVCYCHRGMRSFQAALWLRQEGYSGVVSLSGGIDAWADDVDPDMPRY